ncbi:MAG: hypothetical protein A2V69_01505 [Candidatus Portnoybacteria bacterium RBG_13_40_8]|uniref:Capsule polysaccharide biosynthesis protein n=1 Tax=Candidatus Portnoybacteria bacterium RBG_13_40_8 TaxID=1801990 RepID=A0A1G2F535_9BACT|nr:MAG: hypothetical protein A2V69_01505 [Candidatus Portnoybacteria bacterium RBG_13_40_8]
MKIFLTWNSSDPEIILSTLKGQSNKIVYWLANRGEKYKPSETIFHNLLDALSGIPAKGIDMSGFLPPGKDLIERLHKVESLILTMMNRAKTGKLQTDERKHLYYNMLQYWYGVLKKYKPDIIINQTIPHDISSYLVYELGHLLNIKTIVLEDAETTDRTLIYTDFWQGSDNLHKELKKNQDKNFSLKDLSNDLQEYYKLQTDPNRNSAPNGTIVSMDIIRNRYSKSNSLVHRLKRLKKYLKEESLLKLIMQSINSRLEQNLKKEYKSIQIEPDFNKKFIYVALQVQPECTTSPQGDVFVDQVLMIETLSASLPPGWIIYVKEHPIQWIRRGIRFFYYRYQGYYKKIAELKNVQVIPVEINTYTLINKSQAVATVTGTAAWEAILRSKPSLVFGYPWYRDCSEIFKVKDVESCKNAFKKIASGFVVNQQKIINYLKCFDNATIHGYICPDLEKTSKLTKQESLNNILQGILLEIEKNNN